MTRFFAFSHCIRLSLSKKRSPKKRSYSDAHQDTRTRKRRKIDSTIQECVSTRLLEAFKELDTDIQLSYQLEVLNNQNQAWESAPPHRLTISHSGLTDSPEQSLQPHSKPSAQQAEQLVIRGGFSETQQKMLHSVAPRLFLSPRTQSRYRKRAKCELRQQMQVIDDGDEIKGVMFDATDLITQQLNFDNNEILGQLLVRIIRNTAEWHKHAPLLHLALRDLPFKFDSRTSTLVCCSFSRISLDAHSLSATAHEVLIFLALCTLNDPLMSATYRLLSLLPNTGDAHADLRPTTTYIGSSVEKLEQTTFSADIEATQLKFVRSSVPEFPRSGIIHVTLNLDTLISGDLKVLIALMTRNTKDGCSVCTMPTQGHAEEFRDGTAGPDNKKRTTAESFLDDLIRAGGRPDIRIEVLWNVMTDHCPWNLRVIRAENSRSTTIFKFIPTFRRGIDELHLRIRLGENHLKLILHLCGGIGCRKPLELILKRQGFLDRKGKVSLDGNHADRVFGKPYRIVVGKSTRMSNLWKEVKNIFAQVGRRKHNARSPVKSIAMRTRLNKIRELIGAGNAFYSLFRSNGYFSIADLYKLSRSIDIYVETICPHLGSKRGEYWSVPFYLHILLNHVLFFLFLYRTLRPFSMQSHEGFNKSAKGIFQRHTNLEGGRPNQTNVYFSVKDRSPIPETSQLATLSTLIYFLKIRFDL